MEGEVKPLEAKSIYWISSHIETLRLSEVGDQVVWKDGSEIKEGSGYILAVLEWLKMYIVRHGLCKTEVKELNDLIDAFRSKYCAENASRELDYNDSRELSRCIQRIDAVLQSEFEGRSFFEISFSGLLNYSELLNKGISMLFSDEGVLERMAELVKYDLREAVRGLAHDVPTASAMISLRAVEGALREYYRVLSEVEGDIRMGWKEVLDKVNELIEERGNRSKELIGYLDYIRAVRNKADHPDEIFKKKEAELILIQCARAIEEIYKELASL